MLFTVMMEILENAVFGEIFDCKNVLNYILGFYTLKYGRFVNCKK